MPAEAQPRADQRIHLEHSGRGGPCSIEGDHVRHMAGHLGKLHASSITSARYKKGEGDVPFVPYLDLTYELILGPKRRE